MFLWAKKIATFFKALKSVFYNFFLNRLNIHNPLRIAQIGTFLVFKKDFLAKNMLNIHNQLCIVLLETPPPPPNSEIIIISELDGVLPARLLHKRTLVVIYFFTGKCNLEVGTS